MRLNDFGGGLDSGASVIVRVGVYEDPDADRIDFGFPEADADDRTIGDTDGTETGGALDVLDPDPDVPLDTGFRTVPAELVRAHGSNPYLDEVLDDENLELNRAGCCLGLGGDSLDFSSDEASPGSLFPMSAAELFFGRLE